MSVLVKPRAITRARTAPVATPSDGMRRIRYLGQHSGSRIFKTPSGRKYRFGAGVHREKAVAEADYKWFVAKGGIFEATKA